MHQSGRNSLATCSCSEPCYSITMVCCAYRRIPVGAIVDCSEQIAAFTYQSDRISLGRKPSPRYIGLLIEGAVQHGLPPGYLRYLRNFELAADERLSQP